MQIFLKLFFLSVYIFPINGLNALDNLINHEFNQAKTPGQKVRFIDKCFNEINKNEVDVTLLKKTLEIYMGMITDYENLNFEKPANYLNTAQQDRHLNGLTKIFYEIDKRNKFTQTHYEEIYRKIANQNYLLSIGKLNEANMEYYEKHLEWLRLFFWQTDSLHQELKLKEDEPKKDEPKKPEPRKPMQRLSGADIAKILNEIGETQVFTKSNAGLDLIKKEDPVIIGNTVEDGLYAWKVKATQYEDFYKFIVRSVIPERYISHLVAIRRINQEETFKKPSHYEEGFRRLYYQFQRTIRHFQIGLSVPKIVQDKLSLAQFDALGVILMSLKSMSFNEPLKDASKFEMYDKEMFAGHPMLIYRWYKGSFGFTDNSLEFISINIPNLIPLMDK